MTKSWLYRFLRPVLTFFIKIFFRPRIIGADKISKDGPMVLAGNHTNILDPVLLVSLTTRTIHFLAKIELVKGPFGFIFKHMGIIPVDRNIKDKSVMPASLKCLQSGNLIGIFPEGTTEKGRGLMTFKIGAVKMACEVDSYILPFAITGKYRIFKNSLTIVFGEPYKVSNKDDLEAENNILRDKVAKLLQKGENYGKNK